MAIKLSDHHLSQLREAKIKIDELETFLVSAQIGGLDVTEPKRELVRKRAQINQLRDGFFPGQTL